MSDSLRPYGLYSPWSSPGQNPEVGSLSLLQGIFPTQGSNSGLPHCRQILYSPSDQGSPRYLKGRFIQGLPCHAIQRPLLEAPDFSREAAICRALKLLLFLLSLFP